MLRRRPDNSFEYRDIERVLFAGAPIALSPERKEALRLRIFSQLGAQDRAKQGPAGMARERWIAIPVGVGIAATVIAGTRYVFDQRGPVGDDTLVAMASGSVTVDGASGIPAAAGQRIAATGPSWVAVGENVRVGVKDGAAFRFATSGDRLALLLESGRHHIVSNEALLEVRGDRWAARMTGPGVLEVSIHQWYTSIAAIEGEAVVQHAGTTSLLRAGDPPLLLMNGPAGDPASGVPDASDGHGAANGDPGAAGPGGTPPGTRDDSDRGETSSKPTPVSDPGQSSPAGEQPAQEPSVAGGDTPADSNSDAAATPGDPPAESPPAEVPPAVRPPVDDPPPGAGQGSADDPPGQGHAGEPPAGKPPIDPGQGGDPSGQGANPGQGQPPESPGASGSAGNPESHPEHPLGGPPGHDGEKQDPGRGQGTEQQKGAEDGTDEPSGTAEAEPDQEATAPSELPEAAGGSKASPQGQEARSGAPGQQGKQ